MKPLFSVVRQLSFAAALVLLLLSLSSAPLLAETMPDDSTGQIPIAAPPPQLGARSGGYVQTAETEAIGSVKYKLLKQEVTLWADGKGDVVLERDYKNIGVANWSNTTWYFDWYPGVYSNIRAWDDSGPIAFSTSRSGSRIFVTVYFRRLLQPGQSYRFSMAISIAGMAYFGNNRWNANWYTNAGLPADQYVEGVRFPSNSTVISISPNPTSNYANYVEWRYSNTPSGFSHVINVPYSLSNKSTVPLLLQTSSPWADDTYGNYPNGDSTHTIASLGCFLTSAVMIINYGGARLSPSFSTDPGELNAWFRAHGGYDASHFVKWASIIEYAKMNGVLLSLDSHGRSPDNSRVDYALTSGNPVILGVNNHGHYVLATGKVSTNGQDTYKLNDPIMGYTNLYQSYNNTYNSYLVFAGTTGDKRSLSFSLHSPAELLVTDPLGRKTGYDPVASKTWNEIPDAQYFEDSLASNGGDGQGPDALHAKKLIILTPVDGDYQVEVKGTGTGGYTLQSVGSNWNGEVSEKSTLGTASPGSTDEVDLTYSSNSGVLIHSLDDTDQSMSYNGWQGRTDAQASGGAHRISSTPNDSITFKFEGNSIRWITELGPDQGQAQVKIDGVDRGTLDLYRAERKIQAVRRFRNLGIGKHTITIKVLGTRNINSTASSVSLDAFVAKGIRNEEDAPGIKFNKWKRKANPNASGASFLISNSSQATFTHVFEGTAVEWITARGPSYGYAQVLIDGINQGNYDLFAYSQAWQSVVPFEGLSEGAHTIEIRVLGTKGSGSKGNNVIVDGFRIKSPADEN